MARIELWNGDICDLEVDAIVNAANLSLWMATGVSGAIKRAGGDEIEFAAVKQAPIPLGESIVTPAGRLAAGAVIHAVSMDRDRRTSGPIIEAAVRSAMARAREIGAGSVAFPALGTGVGGFPLEDGARVTVRTVRDELAVSPTIQHVIFALRGASAYHAFQLALAETAGSDGDEATDELRGRAAFDHGGPAFDDPGATAAGETPVGAPMRAAMPLTTGDGS